MNDETTDYTTHRHYDLARRAHSGTSFSPERRAASTCAELDATLQRLRELGASDDDLARVEAKWVAVQQAKTRTVSVMIAGGSNFPVERMRKRNETVDRRITEYLDFVARLDRRLTALRNPSPNDPIDLDADDAIQRLDERIVAAEAEIVEAKATKNALLVQNSRNRLKTLQGQRDKAVALQTMKQSAAEPITFDGGSIVIEEARVQIRLDARPDEAMKTALRGRGFKWSPTRTAWVRAYSETALYWAKKITGAA
jgi:phosphoglycerate-specific signal transduction histidine kinase